MTSRQLAPPGSPRAQKPGVSQTAPPGGVRGQIQKQLGKNFTVNSAHYLGRDATGRPIYKVRYTLDPGPVAARYGRGAGLHPVAITKTITFDGRSIREPNYESGLPDRGGASGGSADDGLRAAKDKWLSQVSSLDLETDQKSRLFSLIEGFRGSPLSLSNMVEQHLARRSVAVDAPVFDTGFDPFAGIGGGGFGSGITGPVYRAPDRRVIEDMARGVMTSLIGTVNEDYVDTLTDVYMKDHRRNFDSEGEEIDPGQSLLEAVRDTSEYQEVHALRPDSEDERNWVSSRRSAAAQGGLAQGQQEDFAIQQASIGGDLPDVRDAASAAQLQTSGSARGTVLEDKIRGVAQGMFTGVR